MSDNSNPTYHGIYLSGNFEIEQKLSPNHGWRSEYRTYVTYIGCGGADRDQHLLYEIKAKGYSSPTYMLSQDYIYYLRGSFFPSNTPETENDQLLFEGSDANVVSACKSCEADLVDSVGVTSLGIVIGIDTIVEKCLPPSPGPSASLSSASDNSGMPKEAVIAEVKKRARYQPKRKLSTASGDVSP
ncbi:uncharacterized protein MELLADRAFT_105273 [Melampsora larici-populina 98AG31]|uniref:Uncharacterized protein n=1 Tax=Melampsora larici-populina (strain 98AG31 / pathotype 3-4-7) TaxID=747676 RepID=F4RHK3_MELLP|nr:uncharacterized protein MELLADRAFT_105273 [Melampsora larici-populina 98AG31]EGG08254.1 hypothetical protein MELLADRAFT_105273 [Melampsora larici-populina 98AG31]